MADDKKFFIMLSLLIPGPDAVTANHIDVFLGPLIHIWMEGIMCADVARSRGETRFRLRTMLLCCIHDFPEAHIRWAFMWAKYARFGERLADEANPMMCSGIKRLPTLFTLPYWKVKHSRRAWFGFCYCFFTVFPNLTLNMWA